MNIQFKLRGTGDRNPKIILFVFDPRFNARKFVYSTSLSIERHNWDKRKNRPKLSPGSSTEAMLIKINKHLDLVETAAKEFLGNRYGEIHLTKSDLSEHIKNKIENLSISKEEDKTFTSIWENLIETTRNVKTGVVITEGTKRSKTQTLNLITDFFKSKNQQASFNLIDLNFYHSFDAFMTKKGLNVNTRGKHFKEIKAVLREAYDRDIPVNMAFEKKSFRVLHAQTDNVYLNDDEIKKIFNLKLSPAQEKLRDIFVVACYVGARHSDWHQISKMNSISESGKQMLRINQTKTREITHVPIHSAVKMIFDKYNGIMPKVITNQKFNEALKVICRKAELGLVNIGGQTIEKAELITTHTARRSFATNAYLSRTMDVYQIMKCTGHKSESSFLRYLKLDGKDFAIQAADSKFFQDDSWSSLKVAS